MEDDRIVYTLPDGRKKYIPQNLAAKFEQQNPMATQAYQDGADIYDIPVRDRNDFLKEFPKATLYSDQQQTQEPAAQQEPIQQPAEQTQMPDSINGHKIPQVHAPQIAARAEQQRQEDNKPEGWDQRTEDFDKDYQAAIGDINARLEAKRNEAVSRQQEREGKMGRFVSSIVNAGMNENGGAVTPEAREEIEAGGDDEARALRSAAQFYEEAKKTREAAVNGAGFGKGLADAFTIDNWDFGITDLVSNASLYNAAVKEEKGEKLTDAEQSLLDAAAHKVASDMYYGNFLGRGYKAGLTTGESLPFMAEFMMNPAAGGAKEGANVVTRALGRAISKKIGAKYGTEVARDIVAKPALKKALQAGSRVLGDVEASAIMTGTTGLGGTIADTYDRMTGDIKFKETEDGIKFDGIDGDMGQFWPSFGKAYGARTIENFSEMFGDYFLPIGKTVGGIVRGVNKSLHLNRVNDFINGIGTAEWMTAVNHFLSKTHWDGIFGETGEELVGGVLNALTVGDQTVGEVFDKDNLIDTFLGVSSFAGFVSAVKTVGYRTPRQQMQIARDKLARNAAKSFATEDDWNRIRQQIDNADEMKLRDILSVAFEEGSQYTPEQKTFIGQYARMREQQIGYDKGRARKEEEMPNFADIDAIYDAAVTTVDPEEKRAAKVEYDNALADLSSLPKEEIDALNQDPGYTVMLEADFPEMAPALERYVKARAALVGINDSINKAMEDDMQRAHDDIESKTAEDGNYYDITLRDGTKVGLKSGVLVRAQDGGVDKRQSGNLFVTMPDGKVKMVAPKDVESFKMAPAADLYEQAEQQIREAYQRQLADDINTPSKQEIADSLTGQPEAFNVGGATVMGTATQVTPDGNVVVQFDEPVQLGNAIGTVHAIPKDEFLKMRAGTVMPTQQVEEQPQEDAQEAAEETEAPEQQEPQQGEETQQEEAQYAGERDFRGRPMPMKEDGRVDQAKLFESDPEAWAEWETKRRNDGGKSAQGYLKGEASRQTKQLNDLQKKFDAEADFDKRDDLGEQIAAVQQRIDAITKAAESAEARQKVREARDAEPQTPDEVVAQYLSAYKGSLNKDDFLRETGYSDEDLKGFVGGFVKEGSIGVQRLAEIIKESDDTGLTSNLSDMDIRDSILNVLSQVRSWNDVKNFIKNNRAAMAEEQARQEQEAIEAAQNAQNEQPVAQNAQNAQEISETPAEISEKQQEIAEAEAEVDTEPTEAQKEAGNYKKGHIKLDGYDISIEQPKGSVRSGVDANGREWSQVMNNTYGYIRGTEGVDGDHIDVFLSDNPEEGNVYVVDQVNPDGTFDEHKVMYGFPDMEAARAAYLSNYEEGWTGLGAITGVSKEEFKKWIESSHRKTKPFSEYSSVKTEGDVQLGQPVEQESAEMAQEEAVSDQDIPEIAQNTEEAAQPVEEVQEQPQRYGQVHKKAEMMAAALNTPIVVHDDVSTVEDAAAASAINAGEIVKGWMQGDGTVHIYAPNADSLRDVEQTVFHEVVAHKGLREMLGEEGFNELCDRVWDAMDSNLHSIYHRKVLHLKMDKDESLDDFFKRKNRAAADEYMAEIAERMTTEKFEKSDSIWKKIVDFFRDIFHLRGADLEMTDKEISDLLSESYKRLRERKEAEWMRALSEDGRAVISKANEYKRMMLEWMQERDEDKSAANVRQREEMRRDIHAQMRQLPDEDLAKIADRYNDFIGQEAREALNRRQILAKTTAVARAVASIQMLHNVKAKPVKKVNLYDYVSKEKLRPMLIGVKHEDGYAVATDATVLIADKASYQKEKDGKTIAKDGKEIKGVYPDWKMLFAGLSEKIPVDIPAMRDFVASVREAAAKRWEDAKARGEKSIGTKKDALEKTQVFVKIGDNAYSFRLGRLSLFLDYAATVGATTLMRNGNFMFGFKNDKGMGLIMASLIEFQNDAEFEAERGVEQLGYYSYWPGVEAREPQEEPAAEEEPASESQPEEPAAEEDQQPEEEVEEETEDEETRPEPGSKIRGDSKIDDFGEKIAGARKDLYRDKIRSAKNYSTSDLKELKDPDKIFSRKNIIKAMSEGKMSKEDATALLAMNMAARNDFSSAMKALALEKYRDMAVAWEAGEPVALNVGEADVKLKTFDDYHKTYEALDYPAVNRKMNGIYIRKGEGRASTPLYFVVSSPKAYRGFAFADFDKAVAKVKAMCPEIVNVTAEQAKAKKEGGDKIGNMSVVKDKYGWYRIKSGYIPGEIYLSKKFYNKKEAEQFLQENADMLIDRENKMAESLMGSNIGMVERQGKDYRGGRDITPEEFMQTFGPKGVQFGNWVPQAERQAYLNKTYDAIMDLCDILHISPESFFLGGKLGISFGGRGHSRALAHYEPLMEVMNLTRMKGAGSLAHEWFHAMDNYLSRQKTGSVRSFATETNKTEREEVAEAFRDFVRKMDSMDYTRRSERAGEYWGEVVERAARLFENYVYNELGGKGVVSPLLVRRDTLFGEEGAEDYISSSWPYPSAKENEEIKPYFDKLFDTIQERVDENTGRTTLFRITKKEGETDLNFLRRVADDLTTKYTNLGWYVNIDNGVEGGDNGDYSDRIVRIFAKPGRDYDSYEETFFHENLHCYLESLGVDSNSPVVIDFLDSFRTNLPDIMGAWEADIREAYKDEGYVESEMFVRIVSDIMSKRVDARILFPFLPKEAMDIIDNYYNAIGYDTAEEKDLGRDEDGGGRDVQPSEGRAAGDLRMVQAESTEEEPGRDTDREIARAVASITGRNEEDVLQDMQDRKDADFITEDTRFRIRTKPEPKKKGIGYKVFYLKDGKLYPPMVANAGGEDTPVGVWLDAEAAPIVGESKTGRPKVKQGGKGTQGGSGTLAYRPGWHLGEIPYALQFNRLNPETGEKDLFPKDFVWAEVEYAADNDYQQEADAEGITENGKFRHSYAGLKRVPEDGFYRYRTNPNPATDPWIITGAMRVKRVLTNDEVDDLVRKAGREPQKREGGDMRFRVAYHGSPADFTEFEEGHYREGTGSFHRPGFYFASDEKSARPYAYDRGNGAFLYEVELPDDDGTNYIHVFKTIPKSRRREIAERINEIFPDKEINVERDVVNKAIAGEDLMKMFTNDELEQLGFVGVEGPMGLATMPQRQYIMFNPKDIKMKSKTNVATGDTIRFRIANKNQEIFVSNAQRALDGIKMEKATPEQWLKMLEKNGGLKAGEDKWLGLSDWLRASEAKTITKQEISDFIEQNKIQIEEKRYRDRDDVDQMPENELAKEFSRIYAIDVDGFTDKSFIDSFNILDAIDFYNDNHEDQIAVLEDPTDISDEDYNKLKEYGEEILDKMENGEFDGDAVIDTTRLGYTTEGLTHKREIALTVPTIEPWNENDSIHFGDAGGGRAVAWIRFGDATKEGQRVLFIDEIQSRRHQEGREKGYREDNLADLQMQSFHKALAARAFADELIAKYGIPAGTAVEGVLMNLNSLGNSEDRNKLSGLVQERNDAFAQQQKAKKAVPPAPFEKNWHELAMKRMLRLAAEEGYDYVAWTTGDQQAERYDLSKVVRRIEGGIDAIGKRVLEIDYPGGGATFIHHDAEGMIDRVSGANTGIIGDATNISEVVGKEIAAGVLSVQDNGMENKKVYEGDNLRIGGEGMRGFYDEILPRFMNKYGKQWGVKVEDITLPGLENGDITAHAVPVTQGMKDSVMEWQTMFRKVYHGTGADFDKFDHSFMGSGEGNQAFGWGTYVTTNKDTGLSYAEQVGGSTSRAEEMIKRFREELKDPNISKERKAEIESGITEREEEIAAVKGKRHLYEVEIPDDNGENYLHWEEPLTGKQSRKIMDAIRKMVNPDEWGEEFEYELQSALGPGTYGRHVYGGLNYFLGNEYNYATDEDPGAERNSKLLNSLGIVGMEYPIDIMGAKRYEGRNYVIFNDKDLKITGHTRFRIGPASGDLRGRYEERLKKIGFLEAHQDSMLALKVLQEELVKESGKPLQSFENAYLAENQLSSVNSAEKEYYQRQYFDPMIKAVRDVMDAAGMTYGEVVKYAIAKHGLERNQVFHDRDQAASDETIPYRDYSGLTSLFLLDGEDAIDLSEAEARAEQYVDDVENRAGQACANMWGKVKDATKKALYKSWQSGILTRSEYESIRDMFDFYVPLRGFDEETAEQHYEYLDHKSSPFSPALRTAKGRSSIADDPFATIGNMWESTVQQGNNNLVKQNFLNMVLNRPNELVTVKPMWYTYDAAADEWSQAVPTITDGMSKEDIQKEWDDFENRMAQMEQQGLASKKKPNRGKVNIPYRLLNKQDQEHMVVVKSAGREYVLVVNGNPRAAQAINGMTNPDRQDFLAKMAKANRWMAANFTTRSPKFVVRNAFRDTLFSLFSIDIKEDSDYNRAFRGNLMRNYGRIWGLMKRFKAGEFDNVDESSLTETERLFREFMMNGGETGYTQLKRVDEYKKMVNRIVGGAAGEKMHAVKSAWRVVDDMVGFANRCVEDICRLSAYMTSRQMGRSIQTSVANAKEISVNFNKKGSGDGYGSSFARAAYLFYNAGVQGLNNFVNIRKNSRKHWTGLRKFDVRVAEMLALGALIPFLNNVISAAVGGDDDEYADLPDWIRRNNLVLGGGGFYVTVPLPIELRALYGIGDIAYMSLAGRMKNYNPFQLGVEVMGQIADIMPLNPVEGIVTNKGKNIGEGLILSLVPDVTAPIAQAALNVDFTGKPIYKKTTYNESMPAYTKAYAGTSKVLVRSAELLNRVTGGDEFGPGAIDINPAIVEHLMEGYFGGLLTFAEENAKTVQAIWDEDYRQLRNVPIANILFQKNDERTASSYVNDMYFYYKKEAEETNRRAKGYKAKGDLNKAAEIAGSKEYRRARLFKGTEKRIRKLQDQLKEETDKTRQDYLRRRIADEKEAFIKVLDDKDLD